MLGPEIGQNPGTTVILYGPGASGSVAMGGGGRALNAEDNPRVAPFWGLSGPRRPLSRLLPPPLQGGSGEGWAARGCPFKSASRRLPSRRLGAARRHQSPPPGPEPAAEGRANRPGGSFRRTPLSSRLGGADPREAPRPRWARPCRPGGRGAGAAGPPGGAAGDAAGLCGLRPGRPFSVPR